METVYLNKNREKSILNRHPWIFSGALQSRAPHIEDGDMVAVCSSDGVHLGYGYFNSRTPIAIRMLSFSERPVTDGYLRELLINALNKRTHNPLLSGTNALRLVFSEGDFLPGLIVDRYNEHLVVQFLTLGMEKLRDPIINILVELARPAGIYERSEHEGRKLEGISERCGQVYGATPEEVVIEENGVSLFVNLHHGQKTGFFIDQRENRLMIQGLARDRSILNLFSYTGGFSLHALKGGAREVISVDSSQDALDMAERNAGLNGYHENSRYVKSDVFQYIRESPLDSSLIICDPPALVKNRSSLDKGCRGYKDLNLQIARRCPAGTLLLTCSCSRFVDMDLFQKVLFSALTDSGRNASILGKFTHPGDHPVSIYCPETEYLKAVLLYIE